MKTEIASTDPTPEIFAPSPEEWGADVIGMQLQRRPGRHAGCDRATCAPPTTLPLSAQPNAGMPRSVEGRNIYLCSPEYMASYARKFVAAGVRLIGGAAARRPIISA